MAFFVIIILSWFMFDYIEILILTDFELLHNFTA